MEHTQEECDAMKENFAASVRNLAKEKYPDMVFMLCCSVNADDKKAFDEECRIMIWGFSYAEICNVIGSIFDKFPAIKQIFSVAFKREAKAKERD